MSQPDEEATLAAAERLQNSMDGLSDEIRGLQTYGQRNRHYIWGLGVSLVLDIILSVAVAVIAVQANSASTQASNASSQANRNQQTQQVTCKATNDAREANRNLWTYIINVTEQSNADAPPAQKAQIEKLRDFVEQVFAARDCSNLNAPRSIPLSPPR